MIGELIQEYLVGLGVRLDRPGFAQAEATINRLDHTVEAATGNMARNFVRASAMIGTAITGVTASVFGLMKSAATQDIAMEKLSRQMMVGKDAAWAMKSATDALGESIQDIMLTPELMGRFEKLTADGRKMQIGGDFAETMKNFRDLTFEFTRLKQEVSYAMTWVGYYLMKYLNRPLAEAREKFRSFNDMFVKNMSVWTEKAARMLVYIINVGRHFLTLIVDIGKALWGVWESFPRGVKIAAAALAGLTLVLRANPLTRMLLLVGSLLLLIDDYYGHMEGKQSAFGKYWDKLNEYIDTAKVKWEAFKEEALPFWERFIDLCGTAKDRTLAFARSIGHLLERVGNSDGLLDFLGVLGELGKAIWHLTMSIGGGLIDSLQMFYEAAEKHGALDGLGKSVELLWGMVVKLIHAVALVIGGIADLTDEVRKTEEYRDFIDAIAELTAVLLELFNVVLDLINIAFRGLFGEMGKTNHVYTFRDAIRAVLTVFTGLIRAVSRAIKLFSELLSFMRDSKPFRLFWEEMGKMVDAAIEKVGKFGRALLALKDGDFKKAWQIIKGEDVKGGGTDGKFGTSKKAVDAAMLAISGQESGGNYDSVNTDSGASGAFQIMPENWPSWAENAGIGADAPMTQENQNIVARHKMLEYYNQFGNWRDVAIAWYGGPGAVDYSEAAKNAPQYYNGNEYPSINEYADSVVERMKKIIADWGGLEEEHSTTTPAYSGTNTEHAEESPPRTDTTPLQVAGYTSQPSLDTQPQEEKQDSPLDVLSNAVEASIRLNPAFAPIYDAFSAIKKDLGKALNSYVPTAARGEYHIEPLAWNGDKSVRMDAQEVLPLPSDDPRLTVLPRVQEEPRPISRELIGVLSTLCSTIHESVCAAIRACMEALPRGKDGGNANPLPNLFPHIDPQREEGNSSEPIGILDGILTAMSEIIREAAPSKHLPILADGCDTEPSSVLLPNADPQREEGNSSEPIGTLDGILTAIKEVIRATTRPDHDPVMNGEKNAPSPLWQDDELRPVLQGAQEREPQIGLDFLGALSRAYAAMKDGVEETVRPYLEVAATSKYSVDPFLYQGLMAGTPPPTPERSGEAGSIVYQVNVGGVTVNGTNKSATEIGKNVGRETMTLLEKQGAHILRSRTMTGAPVMI